MIHYNFVKFQKGTDPRPLYFIPYDPDVDQTDNERIYCKRILFERIHSTVIAAIGRIVPPVDLELEAQNILNASMFGMFEHWENKESARHMQRQCAQLMDSLSSAINSVAPNTVVSNMKFRWKFSIQDQAHHERVIDALTRFSSASLNLKEEPPPDLFN